MKEELTTDTEGEGSLMGDSGSADLRGTEMSPLQSDARQQTSPPAEAPSNHVHIKEEPQERDLSVLSPFSMCRDRPGSGANSLDLAGVGMGVRSSPGGPTTASLFSPDISTKTATDLLMKLSGQFLLMLNLINQISSLWCKRKRKILKPSQTSPPLFCCLIVSKNSIASLI